MNNKFRFILQAFSIVVIGSCIAASCGGSEQSFRNETDNNAEVKAEKPATSNTSERKKDDTPAYDGPVTTYTVNEEVHDYGEIDMGGEYKTVFVLTNTGDNPLIIDKAKGSCGCTVPQPPKEPILPGETGEIPVTFKPKGPGSTSKTVTITANTNPAQKVLRIKANVQEDPSAPKKEAVKK